MPEASSPTSAFTGTWNATALTMVICGIIAGYNAIEGFVLIMLTFTRYKGLYFWSLIVADLGILIYMVLVTLWHFALIVRLAALLPLYVGWICMVTRQSVVLYSRFGIVLGPERADLLHMTKWMIIVDAIAFRTSTISAVISKPNTYRFANMVTVITLCSFYASNPNPASPAYYYMERLHITAFSVQGLILSGLYIWTAIEILQASLQPNLRHIVVESIMIDFILVGIDVAGITLEYCNLFFFEVAFKTASYSIKLKLEFAILSKLTVLSGGGEETRGRETRGDSLVFPTDTLSTAVDKGMYRQPSDTLVHREPPTKDEPKNLRPAIMQNHYTTSFRYDKANSEHSEHIETYGDFVRSTSRGY